MTSYAALYRFNDIGLDAFQKAFTGQIDDTVIDRADPGFWYPACKVPAAFM